MEDQILNEQLRMIYLTEDIWGLGQTISQKLKSISISSLTPEKLKQSSITVPPLNAVYDLVKTKVSTFDESKKKIEGLKVSENVKKTLIVSYASLRELQEKDMTLREHIQEILEYFIDFLGNLTAAFSETTISLFLLHLFIRLFKSPTFTVRLLWWSAQKFLVASIILILLYGLAKGTWMLVAKDKDKEEPQEVK